MKHAIKTALEQSALLQQGASVSFDSRVCQQIGWRWKQVGNVNFGHLSAVEFSFFENFTSQACAQKSCATGNE